MTIWPTIKSVARFAWSKVEQVAKWGASVASEPNGTGSASRVCLFLITATVCAVLIGHLYLRHSLPDQVTLLGLGGLLTAGASGYGTNKVASRPASSAKE